MLQLVMANNTKLVELTNLPIVKSLSLNLDNQSFNIDHKQYCGWIQAEDIVK